MLSVQIRVTTKKIHHLVQLSKQALREGAYLVSYDFTLWLSIWRT